MIPGLGDGIKTVKGSAASIAMMYRAYAKDFTVYVFSRKNGLEQGCTTRDMARDQKEAMVQMGISQADIMGVSQGGMIAQYLALDYPELVHKLVLAVTLSRQNETVKNIVTKWVNYAEQDDYKSLMIDIAEKSYTEQYLKKYRRFYPLLTSIGKPKSFERFFIQAEACQQHDAYEELDRIEIPTLVIGADADQVVSGNASKEIAEQIRNSRLIMYEGYGHGSFEEVKTFNRTVIEFLKGDL